MVYPPPDPYGGDEVPPGYWDKANEAALKNFQVATIVIKDVLDPCPSVLAGCNFTIPELVKMALMKNAGSNLPTEHLVVDCSCGVLAG